MLLFVTSVVLGGLSLLACLVCPLWAYAASRKWEAYLAQRNESVRKAARDAGRDSKPVVVGLGDIPGPVKRYFERCLRDTRTFRHWSTRTVGELRFDARSAWRPIDAATVAAVQEPAFSYTGTLQMGPGRLVWFRGREGYLDGKGEMQWRLWGAVPVAKQDGAHLDQSSLVRYLGEAVCFPPALLPSAHLKWLPSPTEPERCARAVLSWQGAVVAVTFTFDGMGRIKELRSNDFYRVLPGNRVVRTPWFGRCSRYMRFGLGGEGIEVPTSLEVGFVEPSGEEFVYGRFTVANVHAER